MVTMPNRIQRLKEYADPCASEWRGPGRDKENLAKWAERASENSQIAPRAIGKPSNGIPEKETDPPELPNTGKKMETRDTAMRPKVVRSAEAAIKAARSNLNHVGEHDYMPGIKRYTS
jgi:hypothetical protein